MRKTPKHRPCIDKFDKWTVIQNSDISEHNWCYFLLWENKNVVCNNVSNETKAEWRYWDSKLNYFTIVQVIWLKKKYPWLSHWTWESGLSLLSCSCIRTWLWLSCSWERNMMILQVLNLLCKDPERVWCGMLLSTHGCSVISLRWSYYRTLYQRSFSIFYVWRSYIWFLNRKWYCNSLIWHHFHIKAWLASELYWSHVAIYLRFSCTGYYTIFKICAQPILFTTPNFLKNIAIWNSCIII